MSIDHKWRHTIKSNKRKNTGRFTFNEKKIIPNYYLKFVWLQTPFSCFSCQCGYFTVYWCQSLYMEQIDKAKQLHHLSTTTGKFLWRQAMPRQSYLHKVKVLHKWQMTNATILCFVKYLRFVQSTNLGFCLRYNWSYQSTVCCYGYANINIVKPANKSVCSNICENTYHRHNRNL